MAFRFAVRVLFVAFALAFAPAAAQDSRIVLLVPSFADDLAALHAEDSVVGVSAFTLPPTLATRPRVADFQSVNTERIVALHPSVVFGLPTQARFVEPLRRAGVHVELLADDTYEDIFTDLRTLAKASGKSEAGSALERKLRAATANLRARAARFHHRPSVFVALGTGPIWSAGPNTFIGTLIDFAGGRDVASTLGSGWGQYSEEALVAAQPDVIITSADEHLDQVLGREPWRSLKAVKEHHVFVLAHPDILYRPGPDYNEGLRWLLERLTPLST